MSVQQALSLCPHFFADSKPQFGAIYRSIRISFGPVRRRLALNLRTCGDIAKLVGCDSYVEKTIRRRHGRALFYLLRRGCNYDAWSLEMTACRLKLVP